MERQRGADEKPAGVGERVAMPVMLGRSPAWLAVCEVLPRVARSGLPVVVLGETGTGKELVARAIHALSARAHGGFVAQNCGATPDTLIESELFGHSRGAFTGAVADRAGWLEVCPPLGTVFLDEIGDLDPEIQVKLLRVLQARTFQRLGDTQDRVFPGKIIAATNRDLAAQMQAGRFRPDFYYRLCSDLIVTPSLHEQLREDPGELRALLLFLARRIVTDEAEDLAKEVETWIDQHLGPDYPWPGNVRELEQCVRNILIHQEYRPPQTAALGKRDQIARDVAAGKLTADELIRRYCTLVYHQTGSYEETARRIGLDRRTVKSRVDEKLLAELRAG
jgi:transcriptional regulator with PAS, ATPase and Fis domain